MHKGADSIIDGTGGGLGGQVHAVIPVTPGDALTLKVGGQAADTTGGWGGGSGGSSYTFGAGGGSTSIATVPRSWPRRAAAVEVARSTTAAPAARRAALRGGTRADASGGNHGGGGGGWNGGAYDTGSNGAGYGGTSYVNVGRACSQRASSGRWLERRSVGPCRRPRLSRSYGRSGQVDLHVEDASGTTIASTFVNPVEPWYVTVQAGRRYYLVVDAGYDNGADIDFAPPAYGIWSDDPAINPDGICRPVRR